MKFGISLPVRELGDDLDLIADFAREAEALGLTHLRVPEQVYRAGSGPLHEPMTMMTYIAAVTSKIELVPSVIILPARPTVLVAKQAATLDRLSSGRLRLGIGVGKNPEEYQALGADFSTRGDRCEEQIDLLRRLWTEETVDFDGKYDTLSGAGINPCPSSSRFRYGLARLACRRNASAGVSAGRRMAGSTFAHRMNSRACGTISTAPRKRPVAIRQVLVSRPGSLSSARARRNGRAGLSAGARSA